MRCAILCFLLMLSSLAGAEKAVELEGGRSPDGGFFIRIQPAEPGEIISLEVCRVGDGAVIGSTHAGGYAQFSMVADAMNTAVLWAPDSRHLALMTRGTKRTTELRVFAMTAEGAGMMEVALPSPTQRAFDLIKAKGTYRCVFQSPLKWADKRTLTVRARGGFLAAGENQLPQWYEVDVTYNIDEQKIEAAQVVEVKSFAG